MPNLAPDKIELEPSEGQQGKRRALDKVEERLQELLAEDKFETALAGLDAVEKRLGDDERLRKMRLGVVAAIRARSQQREEAKRQQEVYDLVVTSTQLAGGNRFDEALATLRQALELVPQDSETGAKLLEVERKQRSDREAHLAKEARVQRELEEEAQRRRGAEQRQLE